MGAFGFLKKEDGDLSSGGFFRKSVSNIST